MRTMLVIATLLLLSACGKDDKKKPELPPIKASELAGELERNSEVILDRGNGDFLRCTKGGGGPTCVPCGKWADCVPPTGGGTGTGTGTGGKGGIKVGKVVVDVDTINCPCQSCGSGCSGPCAIVCATDGD